MKNTLKYNLIITALQFILFALLLSILFCLKYNPKLAKNNQSDLGNKRIEYYIKK